jgi:S1-C subfamily serine protease
MLGLRTSGDEEETPMSDAANPLLTLSDSLAALVARTAPGVVGVRSHRARSSGFVWRPNLIVTAEEALAEEGEVEVVLAKGERLPARVVGRDPSTDVALLRVESPGLVPVALAPAPLAAGALAVVVGADGDGPVAALGLVASVGPAWQSMRGGEIEARIGLDLTLPRRTEGALALDAAGRAFGMAVLGPRRRVLVIPAATIERVAAQLEAHGRIARGYLGLGLQPVRLDDGAVGAMVMNVDRSGPGAAAGIRQGDMIVAWNGEPIRSVQGLIRSLGPGSVGTVVALSIRRAGEPVQVSVTIGERPPA